MKEKAKPKSQATKERRFPNRRNKTEEDSELTLPCAPDFRATAVGGKYGSGREVSLTDFRGAPLVLYFYPKDDTPGCTAQACGLRDAWGDFDGSVEIFGVSTDPIASHEKFIAKYRLPFPLLSDPDHKIAETYGVWVEKSMYGKKYMGTERTTFVIDAEGRIAKVLRRVKPEEHVTLLREALREFCHSERSRPPRRSVRRREESLIVFPGTSADQQ